MAIQVYVKKNIAFKCYSIFTNFFSGNQNFIKELVEFDKDNMSDRVLKRIGQYCAQPDFMPDIIGKFANKLCWVIVVPSFGMGMYHPDDHFYWLMPLKVLYYLMSFCFKSELLINLS